MEKDERKEDIRVIKSKRELKISLMELLKIKSFDKINVIDICKFAKVNRMTFYNHYSDKYDLFNDAVMSTKEQIFNEYAVKAKGLDFKKNPDKCLFILTELIVNQTIKYQDVIYNLILHQDNDIATYILKNTCDDAIKYIITSINDINSYSLNFPIELVSAFISGGTSSIVVYWLNHRNEISKEEFLDSLYKAIKLIINSEILLKIKKD